jgi:hypothetical protein
MGKSLNFYVLKNIDNLSHDKTKKYCFDCDEQVDYRDLYGYIYDSNNLKDFLGNKSDWCSKCRLYCFGVSGSNFILDKLEIKHSYSNEIWYSDLNIKKIIIGIKTEFTKKFNVEKIYNEITKESLSNAYRQLEYFDIITNKSDMNAYNETKLILDFCKNSFEKENDVMIILEEEY